MATDTKAKAKAKRKAAARMPERQAASADARQAAASLPGRSAASKASARKPALAAKRVTIKRAALGPVGRLEDFIPFKLAVVANRVSQSIGRLFETKFNIQIPEWRILMALYAYGDQPFNEVVDRTSMDKARVSRAQRRLVDLGMIETESDPTDGRRINLSITPAGAKMCADILPEAAAREAWYLAALNDDEHRQLDLVLDKLMIRSQEG